MRRQSLHLAFGTAAASFALLAGYEGWALHHAERVNAAIANASTSLDETVPEARFARATAHARVGDYEAALKSYKAIIQGDRRDLRLGALYDLGNLHMRAALKAGPDAAQAQPLIELAKQSYRDLLRSDPSDWDARYNLERALWLAPEREDAAAEEEHPPIAEKRVIPGVMDFTLELP